MTALLARSHLSRRDLRLYLSNWNGYAQDAASVRYTIFARDGSQVSGTRLQAIRSCTGEYYAPWIPDVPNGNYRIDWEIQEEFGSTPIKKTDFFFVVDPSAYPCGAVTDLGTPTPGQFTFLTGQSLGPGDLPLFLRNSSGFLQDAFAVFFTIFGPGGCRVSPRTVASHASVGTYYASWHVGVGSGDYVIQWEFQQDQNSPLESVRMGFSVVCPLAPFALVEPVICTPSVCCGPIQPACSTSIIYARAAVGCCSEVPRFLNSYAPCTPLPCSSPTLSPTPSPGECCYYEIPRVIHLATGHLPPSGSFTDQPYYTIPTGIRRIAFYVTYTRGAPGGYMSVRLMWGDGVNEIQETLLDCSVPTNGPITTQNMYLQEMNGPVPQDDNPISFIVETRVPGGAKTVRLIAAEKGVPGAPGIAGITLTAATD